METERERMERERRECKPKKPNRSTDGNGKLETRQRVCTHGMIQETPNKTYAFPTSVGAPFNTSSNLSSNPFPIPSRSHSPPSSP